MTQNWDLGSIGGMRRFRWTAGGTATGAKDREAVTRMSSTHNQQVSVFSFIHSILCACLGVKQIVLNMQQTIRRPDDSAHSRSKSAHNSALQT
jgi:hypothetical protein